MIWFVSHKINILIIGLQLWIFYSPNFAEDIKFGYTAEEKQIIPEFRKLVENNVIEKYMLHDSYLVRWIRSTKYDLEKARGKFSSHIKWRKSLVNDPNYLTDVEFLKKNFPHRTFQSPDGRPGYTARFSEWNIRKAEITSKQRYPFTRYLSKAFDDVGFKIIELANNGNNNLTNGINLFDVGGYDLRTHACVACIPDLLNMAGLWETQYPQLFGDVILFNSPRIFENLLSVLTQVLGDYYKKTIKVYGLNKNDWEGPVTKLFGRKYS